MTETATEYDEYYDGAQAEYEGDPEAEAGVVYEYGEDPEVEYEEPGAELAVVETETAEVVEVAPLTERQAKALNKKIRAANDKMNTDAETLFDLLEQAAAGRIHEALGYSSWTAWVADNVALRPQDREQRKRFVQLMTGRGMSTRAAAKALNVSQKTASRDAAEGEYDSDTVTSLDGSQRSRRRTTVIDAEVVSVEEPERSAADVVNDFSNEIDTLLINVQAFKDVLDDELFGKARKRIAQRFVKRLNGAINDLTKIMEEVTA